MVTYGKTSAVEWHFLCRPASLLLLYGSGRSGKQMHSLLILNDLLQTLQMAK